MAIVPEWVKARMDELEKKMGFLEEQLALIVEALAPAEVDEEESLMLHTAMMKKAVLDKNQEWIIPEEEIEDDFIR